MAGKMLIRVNQLRKRYIQNYISLNNERKYSECKYSVIKRLSILLCK